MYICTYVVLYTSYTHIYVCVNHFYAGHTHDVLFAQLIVPASLIRPDELPAPGSFRRTRTGDFCEQDVGILLGTCCILVGDFTWNSSWLMAPISFRRTHRDAACRYDLAR